MVRILAELDTLDSEETLKALLDRRPMMLFPELEERGLVYRCDAQADGVHVLRVAARPEILVETHDA